MAREKGIFHISANYEAQKAAPLDARQLVEAKADLLLPETWTVNNIAWIYDGMIVAVSRDVNNENNGIYMLTDSRNYTKESSWQKMANIQDIQQLQKQIEELQSNITETDVDIDTEAELPDIGEENITYYIKETQDILRWNNESQDYISYGGSGITDLNINIIHGGDSNGNTTD